MWEAIPVKEAGPGAFVMDRRDPFERAQDAFQRAERELAEMGGGDMKIAMASAKPALGTIPLAALTGAARVFAYGAGKYAPGNWANATLEDGAGERYVSAALRHLSAMQLPNGLYSPESLSARDEESGLPHIDHTICGLLMLRGILTIGGAIPADPKETT